MKKKISRNEILLRFLKSIRGVAPTKIKMKPNTMCKKCPFREALIKMRG